MELDSEKIDELLKLEKDNNRMLHKMRRSMAWTQIFNFIYWAAILGIAGWSYYFVQPYINQYLGIYQKAIGTLNSIEKTGNSIPTSLNSLLEKTR